MLKRLEVSRFKAWRLLKMQFGKVTGLFGENSSGKSSVLQLLLLLKQTKNATDRGLVLDFGGPNELVNLGTYQDIVHQGDIESDIEWVLDWELQDSLRISDPMGARNDVLMQEKRLQILAKIGLKGANLSAKRLLYHFDKTDFSIDQHDKSPNYFKLISKGKNELKFIRNQGRGWALPGPIKTHLFPDQARTYYQNTSFLSRFEAAYEGLMDGIFYLGPLREHPQREYRWSGASPADVGPRGERSVDAILAATGRDERMNLAPGRNKMSFQEMIAYRLREMGLIDSFEIQKIAPGSSLYQARVLKNNGGPKTMLTDVGFGVSQVLPVIVLLYYVPEGSIILLEQPEIHLHPSAQSGLADVMLAVAKRRRVQIIVESHSEHLLRRFQRRAAEGEVPSSDLKLYFVSNNDGEAKLEDLKLNEWGQIENWPDHFFGDEMGEIAAIGKASLKKRIDSK